MTITSSTPDPDNQVIDILAYLKFLWRGKWIWLLITAILTGALFLSLQLYKINKPVRYQATQIIDILPPKINNPAQATQQSAYTWSVQRNYINFFTSDEVAQQLRKKQPQIKTAKALQSAIKVTQHDGYLYFTIKISGPDKTKLKQFLTDYLEVIRKSLPDYAKNYPESLRFNPVISFKPEITISSDANIIKQLLIGVCAIFLVATLTTDISLRINDRSKTKKSLPKTT